MTRIRIIAPEPGYTYDLPTAEHAEVVVGRAPYCQLSMPGIAGLAEVHACIVYEKQGYVITDLNTPDGTYANGVKLTRSTLMKPGVRYSMGGLCLMLEDDQICAPEQELQVVQEPPQQPVIPLQAAREPIYVQVPQPVVNIVQMAPPAEKRQLRKTSKEKKRELSVLMARLHRKKRYNYILWLTLWTFLTLLLVTAVVSLAMPERDKQKVKQYLDEKMRVYEAEGLPGLFCL